jgi:hypothetical protein
VGRTDRKPASPRAAAAAVLQDASVERGRPLADKRFWARSSRFYYSELPLLREELSAHGQALLGGTPLRPVDEETLRLRLADEGSGGLVGSALVAGIQQ